MSGMAVTDWEQRYRDGRTGWERSAANPAFLAWRAGGILTPSRVLVPCAGRSAEPAMLVEAGFDLVVVDLAASAIAAQAERLAGLGDAVLVQSDLFTWEPEAPFDAVYDQTALCALPPAMWAGYEERLARWLVPGGRLLILFMQTGREGGPPYDCGLDAMRRLFAPERWVWPDTLEVPVEHDDGLAEQPAVLRRTFG